LLVVLSMRVHLGKCDDRGIVFRLLAFQRCDVLVVSDSSEGSLELICRSLMVSRRVDGSLASAWQCRHGILLPINLPDLQLAKI
jgi:hypothetical protein